MKFTDYLEGISKDLTDIKNPKDYIWIVFDLETTGLFGSQGLKLITGEKYYDKEQKRMRNVYSDKDLEIAEIGVFAYDPNTKRRFSFHQYLKADLSDEVKQLIHWSDLKNSLSKDSLGVLKRLDKLLGLFKNKKKIIIAHNGKNYDFKIMNLMGQKYSLKNIENTFSINKDESSILIDTRDTTKIRKKLSHLSWPKKTDSKSGKEIEVNNQNALLNMLGIKNLEAHTAIEDVSALSKYLIKILRMIF